MSSPPSRLKNILGHLWSPATPPPPPPPPAQPAGAGTSTVTGTGTGTRNNYHIHQLSPTVFLPRAAAIEPHAEAIVHVTANGTTLRRSYREFADRARGLAYYLKTHGLRRVGVLAPNTPAFLECIYGIAAAAGVIVPVNYRLKEDDVAYILDFAEVDLVVVDQEFEELLGAFRKLRPGVRVLVDTDTDATEGELCGPFDEVILEGLTHDRQNGSKGWDGLQAQRAAGDGDEDDTLAIPFTSGTTSRPKGVVYTHRGAYLAALGNVVESGLNVGGEGEGEEGGRRRCGFLWTLPMFHAMGWTFPWGVTAVRGTHVCLRRIDYPLVWRLLREERVTHFSAAPTVNTLLCADPAAARLPRPVRVTVAASPPTPRLLEQMTALNLRPVHVYGMTETYGPVTRGYVLPEWDGLAPVERYGLMARQGHGLVTSLPVRVVRVDQPEGVLVDVARDGREIGEIVFFGNMCAKEYYKDAEATRKAFAGGGLHSGDLAVLDPDGAVRILDRAKDIIISGGENISSVALESMLVQHPDVLEAGVVAVADSHWGERPKAYVTVKEGKSLEGRDVVEWAKHQSQISKFMVPREVEIVKELPKTSTGKIKKTVMREWAKHGHKE